ncbi:hypothetical protein N7467_002005 [Penicillium canescens]|nr:hypothetical protein N7467_002005 [Penicillium canescens]
MAGSQWPSLSGRLCENSAHSQNTNERVLAPNHDARKLLGFIGNGDKVPQTALSISKRPKTSPATY